MFSKRTRLYCECKNDVARQKKVVAVFLTWLVLCSWWGIKNEYSIFIHYQDICIVDLLIPQQLGVYTGIFIFPFALFLIMRCKQDCLNVQCLLRYGDRKIMFLHQFQGSFIYAIGLTIVMIAAQLFFALLKCSKLMNWDREESKFFQQTGVTVKASFILVLSAICLSYIIKFLICLILMDILFWYPRYMFFVWILPMVMIGVSRGLTNEFLYEAFAFGYQHWLYPGEYAVQVFLGVLIIGIMYICGVRVISRADIYR